MTKQQVSIAIDAMGGDNGSDIIIEGACVAAHKHNARLLLVGDVASIEKSLSRYNKADAIDYEIVPASQVVEMTEKPSEILRTKKDSSIHVACKLVKEGRADAFVSAGHSGASVACGMFIIGRMKGVDRPALASIMPSEQKPFVFLDLGATVDCTPTNLLQFALMGNVLANQYLEYPSPRVALLNIGEEEGKGNSVAQGAYTLLKQTKELNFIGNVEGKDVYTGCADVIVCDGFVGNIALKITEGVTSTISTLLKRSLKKNLLSLFGAFLAQSAFKQLKQDTDYSEYGGALILGLKQLGIVAHGRSNAKAIESATSIAITLARKKTTTHLQASIENNLRLEI